MAKFGPFQFARPELKHLDRIFGEASPMGLRTFMGYAPGYAALGGAFEVLGARLLLFRRTATLGALTSLVVLTTRGLCREAGSANAQGPL